MVLPVGLIVSLVTGVMNGPVSKVLDAFVKDQELRRKLLADLELKLTEHLGKTEELEQAIVLAEIKSEHWLTRSWRPTLMLTLLGFIVFVGLVLPLLDFVVGAPVTFNPGRRRLCARPAPTGSIPPANTIGMVFVCARMICARLSQPTSTSGFNAIISFTMPGACFCSMSVVRRSRIRLRPST